MKFTYKTIILTLLCASVVLNIYLLISPLKLALKQNAFCAGFQEQAANRIRTYYTNNDVVNVYPDEIFYSKKENSCIALWSNIETNENGTYHKDVIFDAITNRAIISITTYDFNDDSRDNTEQNNALISRYMETLDELRD